MSPDKKDFSAREELTLIGNMVGETAHKLSNLVGGMLGYAQLLLNELPPETRAARYARTFERAARRAGDLITQLHLLSNPKYAPERKPVAPEELLRAVLARLERSFDLREIRTKLRLRHGKAKVSGDARLLEMAFYRLCENAVQAMPQGGTLTIESARAKQGEVDRGESLSKTQAYLLFRIKDTGTGLSEEAVLEVFRPFYSAWPDSSGVGLGLTLANAAVRSLKGEIRLTSKLGQGTTCEILLPTTQTKHADPEEKPTEEDTRQDKAIMVVDDEDDLLQLAKTIFERKGFRVLAASSGQEALQVFKAHEDEINLVILDVILPGNEGERVYHALKQSAHKPKIILTSGYIQGSPYLKFLEQCDDAFVAKPWDLPDLVKKVSRLSQKG